MHVLKKNHHYHPSNEEALMRRSREVSCGLRRHTAGKARPFFDGQESTQLQVPENIPTGTGKNRGAA
jgi:hypothetical protein